VAETRLRRATTPAETFARRSRARYLLGVPAAGNKCRSAERPASPATRPLVLRLSVQLPSKSGVLDKPTPSLVPIMLAPMFLQEGSDPSPDLLASAHCHASTCAYQPARPHRPAGCIRGGGSERRAAAGAAPLSVLMPRRAKDGEPEPEGSRESGSGGQGSLGR
jgi:hypothetical protein